MLQNDAAFAAFAAVFPELSKLVVDGVVQVENYTVKSTSSPCRRTIRCRSRPPTPIRRLRILE